MDEDFLYSATVKRAGGRWFRHKRTKKKKSSGAVDINSPQISVRCRDPRCAKTIAARRSRVRRAAACLIQSLV